MRRDQFKGDKKSNSNRIITIFMILLLTLCCFIYFISQKVTEPNSIKIEETISQVTKIDPQEEKNIKNTIDSLNKLYTDKRARTFRDDVNSTELSDFKSDIDKIQDEKLKLRFESEYRRALDSMEIKGLNYED